MAHVSEWFDYKSFVLLSFLSSTLLCGCRAQDEIECISDDDCDVGYRCLVEEEQCVVDAWSFEDERMSSSMKDGSQDMSPVEGGAKDMGGDMALPGTPGGGLICEGPDCADVCLELNMAALDFGPVPVGELRTQRLQIKACETLANALYIEDFKLSGPGDVFALNAWSIGGLPFAIEPGGEVFIEVAFDVVAGVKRGKLTLDVSTGSMARELRRYEIEVAGEGIVEPLGNTCPVASGTGTPAMGDSRPRKSFDAFSPGEMLLDGSLSYDRDDGDAISAYRWSVASEPFGAGVTIEDANRAEARVSLEMEGFYILRLRVFDMWGKESCRVSDVRVNVVR